MNQEKDNNEVDRVQLRNLQALFEKAVEKNNIEEIRRFIHPNFSFVSFTDKIFNDFDSFKQQWDITRKKMIGSGRFSTLLNPETTLFSDGIAIASGNASNSMVDNNGQQFNFSNHWTVIFKRDNDEWKVLRAHNSLDPFGNPMLINAVKKKVMKYSLLSFIGGVIVSFIVSYLF